MTDMKTKLLGIFILSAYATCPIQADAKSFKFNTQRADYLNDSIVNTHLPLELKSMPFNTYKLAAVCSLGTGNCKEPFSYNKSEDDTNTKKCSTGYVFVAENGCMLDKCPTGYSEYTCSGSTPIQSGTTTAPSGRICYKCRAEDCSAYPLTICPANANCSDCPDNSSKKKIASCATNYKISGNTCVAKTCPTDFSCNGTEACVSGVCKDDTCPTGYQKSNACNNGIEGTKNTLAGTPCYKCKGCPNNCNLNSCPSGAVCSFEECSGKFCATGCEVGKVSLDNYWCGGALRCWIQ